jgi:hypothetical protein
MTCKTDHKISFKIMEHLQGMNFPASKSELIENARIGHGPDTDEVIRVLSGLKKDRYSSPAELMHEIGEVAAKV